MFGSKKSKLSLMVATAAAVSLLVAGCGNKAAKPAPKPAAAQKAYVGYAGSMTVANDRHMAPAFEKATGMTYQGHGSGAFAVANLIKAGEIQPNVFESIGTAPIIELQPKFSTWSIGFMTQPLVVAYSPQSPFASELKAIQDGKKPVKDLFALFENPKFHLGRTNPQVDPQGQAFIFMLNLAAQYYKLPSGTVHKIIGTVNNPKQVFAETSILSRLQAGELDASSAYLPEAVQHNLPYISLPDQVNMGNPSLAKHYATQSMTLKNGKKVTGAPLVVYVTTIKGTPDQKAGVAFVKFILSPAGKKIYQQQGYQLLTKPVVQGDASAIPQAIQAEFK